jgi:hypothetical protein
MVAFGVRFKILFSDEAGPNLVVVANLYAKGFGGAVGLVGVKAQGDGIEKFCLSEVQAKKAVMVLVEVLGLPAFVLVGPQ